MPQIHIIIQISQVYYLFCHNLWWKFSGKIFELRKKNKQTQFSQLFYFLMHFSFLPWWCTLKMEALVRFCKKTFPGFPTWEIQLLLSMNFQNSIFVSLGTLLSRAPVYLGSAGSTFAMPTCFLEMHCLLRTWEIHKHCCPSAQWYFTVISFG